MKEKTWKKEVSQNFWDSLHLTCEVQSEGDEAVVFAEDAQRLLPLHQIKEVVCHRLSVEEVVYTEQEVPDSRRRRGGRWREEEGSKGWGQNCYNRLNIH